MNWKRCCCDPARLPVGHFYIQNTPQFGSTDDDAVRYKHELDPEGIPQFGLVAEQVEKVNPDLVARDADGKVNTVRYDAINAMLLNEFLKEHHTVEEQGATIAQMQKQIEALTATVRKVSDQVALSKAAPQLVANP